MERMIVQGESLVLADQEEVWRKIQGYENYEVSTHGRVRRWRKASGAIDTLTPILINPAVTPNGYWQVALYRPIRSLKRHSLHRLVLETFRGPAPKGFQGHHIDNNRGNNRLDNLEWVSRMVNISERTKQWYSQPHRHANLIRRFRKLRDTLIALGIDPTSV